MSFIAKNDSEITKIKTEKGQYWSMTKSFKLSDDCSVEWILIQPRPWVSYSENNESLKKSFIDCH